MSDQVTRSLSGPGVAGPGVAAVAARGPRAGAMAQPHASAQDRTEEENAALRAAFVGWNVWRSDEGRWWATRRRPLRPSRWPDGYALTVAADDAGTLRSAINSQPGEARSGHDRTK